MVTRVGINGFGRIGRQSLKAILDRHPHDIEVVAINDITDSATNAHLFRYDSTYGRFDGTVEVVDNDDIAINGKKIRVFAQKDPAEIPWAEEGAQIVIESTGFFTDATKAKAHLHDTREEGHHLGASQERGHHHRTRRERGQVRSGQAPHHLQRLLHDQRPGAGRQGTQRPLGHRDGPADHHPLLHQLQRLLDVATKDLRDARAAGLNIVPTTTGAARAVGLVIPELKGSSRHVLRVPTPTVSVVDFMADLLARPASRRSTPPSRRPPRGR